MPRPRGDAVAMRLLSAVSLAVCLHTRQRQSPSRGRHHQRNDPGHAHRDPNGRSRRGRNHESRRVAALGGGGRITDHFRAAARVQHLLQQSPHAQTHSESGDPAKQHELRETRAEVRQAMDSLPDQYRLALEWKYLDKLSVREIAARWVMTEKAAESILFRARREFRERLVKQQPAEPSRNGKRCRTAESAPGENVTKSASHNTT